MLLRVFMLRVLDCVLVSWSWLRIPGVLQRLGFTYFALSLLQTFWGQREIPLTSVSSPVKFNSPLDTKGGDAEEQQL